MKYIFTSLTLILVLHSATDALASKQAASLIRGTILDEKTGEALGFAYLHLEELNRTEVAHNDGSFEFKNVPSGTYTLSASRIGYRPTTLSLDVPRNDTVDVKIRLTPSVLSGNAILVTGEKNRSVGSELEQVSRSLSGEALRRELGSTLSKTLEAIPGLSSRTMGSAPARPVIRGLGGERVLILQDGTRTGDVSSQSADHAVTVDPSSAEEIEIARGPAALKYGGNAVGGVINVVRRQIATALPDQLHGTGSLQGESVNSGAIASLQAGLPIGSFALQLDGNFRYTQNLQTPEGELANSGLLSSSDAVGLSYIRPWGYAGGAFSSYISNYGIPPDPTRGHPEGVDIEMRKYQADAKSEIYFEESFLRGIEINYSFKNYFHQEFEAGGAIGTEYGVLTTNASVDARHNSWKFLQNGNFGVWAEAKDYAVQGANTPDSDAYSLAGYLIEEKDFGPLHTEFGTRLELIQSVPSRSNPNSRIGNIRERSFAGLASSFAAVHDFGSGFFTGISLLHSFRAPSQEELYSEGPHLASYSYEIGNPNLDPERSFSKELFLRYRRSDFRAELSLYHNDFSNYIYPRNTGRPSVRFPTLNEYQFIGAEALLYGFEFSSELAITRSLALTLGASYTHAEREVTQQERQVTGQTGETQPLPMIPPLKSDISLKYASGGFEIGSRARLAAKQERTGDFEQPTEGYAVFDLFGQYRLQSNRLLHTFSLRAENLLDTSYRSHLSRIKELMPEPGRNVSLLYRVYF